MARAAQPLHDADRRARADAVSHGHIERLDRRAHPECVSEDCTANPDRDSLSDSRPPVWLSHEGALRDADRRNVEPDADHARDPAPCRMQTSVSIDEQHRRRFREAAERGLDERELPVPEVRRDVGEADAALHEDLLDHRQIGCAEDHEGREPLAIGVGDIHAANRPHGPEGRPIRHFGGDANLFVPEADEEAAPAECGDRPSVIVRPSLFAEPAKRPCGDRTTSLRHDAVRGSQLPVFPQESEDGRGGANVPEGAGDVGTPREPASWNLRDELRYGRAEIHGPRVHGAAEHVSSR